MKSFPQTQIIPHQGSWPFLLYPLSRCPHQLSFLSLRNIGCSRWSGSLVGGTARKTRQVRTSESRFPALHLTEPRLTSLTIGEVYPGARMNESLLEFPILGLTDIFLFSSGPTSPWVCLFVCLFVWFFRRLEKAVEVVFESSVSSSRDSLGFLSHQPALLWALGTTAICIVPLSV